MEYNGRNLDPFLTVLHIFVSFFIPCFAAFSFVPTHLYIDLRHSFDFLWDYCDVDRHKTVKMP